MLFLAVLVIIVTVIVNRLVKRAFEFIVFGHFGFRHCYTRLSASAFVVFTQKIHLQTNLGCLNKHSHGYFIKICDCTVPTINKFI